MEHSKILNELANIYRETAVECEEKADQAGRALYASMVDDATKRIQKKEVANKEEAAFLKQQLISRFEQEAKQHENEVKLSYINAVIEEVYESLVNMDDQSFMALLNRSLEREETEEKPRIYVDSKHFERVQREKGQAYQVIEDALIDRGFILMYQHYDVNMELSTVFQYKRDVLVRKAREALFGDVV